MDWMLFFRILTGVMILLCLFIIICWRRATTYEKLVKRILEGMKCPVFNSVVCFEYYHADLPPLDAAIEIKRRHLDTLGE